MPTMRPEDIERLACPVCRQCLALAEGKVRCMGCGRVYPVVDGIPVLIAGRAVGV